MSADPLLATVHYRVELAGIALENAASYLDMRRVMAGIVDVRRAVQHLQSASALLKNASAYPDLQKYLLTLAGFYQGEIQKMLRPANAPAAAASIRGNAGNLLAGDPVLTPGSAH